MRQSNEVNTRKRATYVVAMPSHDIIRAVVLSAFEELAAKLVDDFPRLLEYFISRYRAQEVARIRKAISTKRTQLRQLELRTPDLENVSPRRSIRQVHTEANTALNNAKLTGLNKHGSKLSLNIEGALLGND